MCVLVTSSHPEITSMGLALAKTPTMTSTPTSQETPNHGQNAKTVEDGKALGHAAYNTQPLNVTFNLKPEELEFYKTQTGITDDEELKEHVLAVQKEAYAVHPYPCIRRLAFATLVSISFVYDSE